MDRNRVTPVFIHIFRIAKHWHNKNGETTKKRKWRAAWDLRCNSKIRRMFIWAIFLGNRWHHLTGGCAHTWQHVKFVNKHEKSIINSLLLSFVWTTVADEHFVKQTHELKRKPYAWIARWYFVRNPYSACNGHWSLSIWLQFYFAAQNEAIK